jgi:hypothetical protein
MQISGFTKRKIYNQTGDFTWSANIIVDQNTSKFDFGFSGVSGKINWTLENGKIFDYKNQYIGSFYSEKNLFLSGNINSQFNDFFVDGIPVYIGQDKFSNNYSYLYFNSVSGISNLDFFINGEQPSGYKDTESDSEKAYSRSGSYIEGVNVPLNLVLKNQNPHSINIFSGDISDLNFSFSSGQFPSIILPFSEKTFEIDILNQINGNYSFPVNFYTDFGDFSYSFNAVGSPLSVQTFYILISPNEGNISAGETNKYTSYYLNTSGSDLSVQFEYISGYTGSVYLDIERTRELTGQFVSGFVSGIGLLSGYKTGIVSGFNNLLSGFEYGTGSGIVYFNNFIATGFVNDFIEVEIPALGTGLILKNVFGSGYKEINISGTISRLNPSILVTGIEGAVSGVDFFGKTVSGYISTGVSESGASYLYTVPATGFKLTGEYTEKELEEFSFLSPFSYGTGFFTINFNNRPGFVLATGSSTTGIWVGNMSYLEPGYITIKKVLSGYLMQKEEGAPDILSFKPTDGSADKKINLLGFIQPIERTLDLSWDPCDPIPEFELKISETPENDVYYNQNNLKVYLPYIITGLEPVNQFEEYANNSDFLKKSGDFLGNIDFYDLSGNLISTLNMGESTPSGGRVRISRMNPSQSGSGSFYNPVRSYYSSLNEEFAKFKSGISSLDEKSSQEGWREYLVGNFESSLPPAQLNNFNLSGDLFFDDYFDKSEINFSINEEPCFFSKGDFKIKIDKANVAVLFDLYKLNYYCKQYNDDASFEEETFYAYPFGVNNNNSESKILDPKVFDGSIYNSICTGVGCTGIGFYSFQFTGIKGCAPYDKFFTGSFTGITTNRFSLASTGIFDFWVNGQYGEKNAFFYGEKAFGVNKIPINGYINNGVVYTSSGTLYDLYIGAYIPYNETYDYNYFCEGSGCVGKTSGLYSGFYNYAENANTGFSGIFSGIFFNYLNDGGIYQYIGIASGVEEKYELRNDFYEAFNCDLGYATDIFGAPFKRVYFNNLPGNDYPFYGVSGFYKLKPDHILITGVCSGAGCTGALNNLYEGYSYQYSFGAEFAVAFRGLNYMKNDLSGSSKGQIQFFDCQDFYKVNEKINALRAGPYNTTGNVFSFSQQLASGNYLLKIKYGDITLPPRPDICWDGSIAINGFCPPKPDSFLSFSLNRYTGCEEQRSVGYTINRTGFTDYDLTGLITYSKWKPDPLFGDHFESNEILPSGYYTELPFIIPKTRQSIRLGQILEDEGDLEKFEGFNLTLNTLVPYESLQFGISSANFIISDDDIREPNGCAPTENPVAVGVCCRFDVSGVFLNCIETTSEQCGFLNGVYKGDDTRCIGDICKNTSPPPPPPPLAQGPLDPRYGPEPESGSGPGPGPGPGPESGPEQGPLLPVDSPFETGPDGTYSIGTGRLDPKTNRTPACKQKFDLSCSINNSDCTNFEILADCTIKTLVNGGNQSKCEECFATIKQSSVSLGFTIEPERVYIGGPEGKDGHFTVYKRREESAFTDESCKTRLANGKDIIGGIRATFWQCGGEPIQEEIIESSCCATDNWTGYVEKSVYPCPNGRGVKKCRCHKACAKDECLPCENTECESPGRQGCRLVGSCLDGPPFGGQYCLGEEDPIETDCPDSPGKKCYYCCEAKCDGGKTAPLSNDCTASCKEKYGENYTGYQQAQFCCCQGTEKRCFCSDFGLPDSFSYGDYQVGARCNVIGPGSKGGILVQKTCPLPPGVPPGSMPEKKILCCDEGDDDDDDDDDENGNKDCIKLLSIKCNKAGNPSCTSTCNLTISNPGPHNTYNRTTPIDSIIQGNVNGNITTSCPSENPAFPNTPNPCKGGSSSLGNTIYKGDGEYWYEDCPEIADGSYDLSIKVEYEFVECLSV